MAGQGNGTVIVPWYATGFRAEGFGAALEEVAAIALRYGADSYAVYRSRDDRYRYQQLAHFERYSDWERYWEGPEMIDFRATPLLLVPGAGALRLVGPHRRGASLRGDGVGHPGAARARARGQRHGAAAPRASARLKFASETVVDQAGLGRRERSVLCTRATEDNALRRVHGRLSTSPAAPS